MNIDKLLIQSLVTAVLICSCGNDNVIVKSEQHTKYCLDEQLKKDLVVVQPVRKQVEESIHLTGAVEANPDKVVHFTSLVSGVVSDTYFSLGDRVTKGKILAELRSTELSSLQSELRTLTSQISVAEQKLNAAQSMFADGISSQRDLAEAQSELQVLRSQRQKVTADLSLYSASSARGVFQIKAPASGIITAKSILAGMQITADSEPLFTISDLSEVWVTVNVYATNVRNITTGMPVEIRTLSYPDEVFTGRIAAISQALDNEARVLKARVLLPNSNLKLKPGMLVDVTASKKRQVEAFSIPTEALVFDNNEHFVIVLKSDCDIEARKVEVLSNNKGITFLSMGIDENEKIIAKNQLLIYEQLKNFQN